MTRGGVFKLFLTLLGFSAGSGLAFAQTPGGKNDKPGGAKTLTLDLGDGVKLELVRIEPGEFQMGSPDDEENRDADEARHPVKISKPFYIGKCEVTQKQWRAVMGSNPATYKGEDLPVEEVSWNDCQEFCRKVAQKIGRAARLPTEAEWEYACRAGTATPFSCGATISTDQANYDGNYVYGNGRKGEYREKTTPAGKFPPNPWGLHDMHGNVREWCQDWYGDYPKERAIDPKGPDSGTERVLRGGAWFNNPWYCRSADRMGNLPDNHGDHSGLRLVVEAQ